MNNSSHSKNIEKLKLNWKIQPRLAAIENELADSTLYEAIVKMIWSS